MARYVRFSITVRKDQYESLQGIENRSQLIRSLIDAHFSAQRSGRSLEERLASVETKIDSVLECFVSSPTTKGS